MKKTRRNLTVEPTKLQIISIGHRQTDTSSCRMTPLQEFVISAIAIRKIALIEFIFIIKIYKKM